MPGSPFDEYVGDKALEERFVHQERVMVEAGFGVISPGSYSTK